jgi:hypothetical protein
VPTPTEDLVFALEAVDRLLLQQESAVARTLLGEAQDLLRRVSRYVVIDGLVRDPQVAEHLRRVGIEFAVEDQRTNCAVPLGQVTHRGERMDLAYGGAVALAEIPAVGDAHRAVDAILRGRKAECDEAPESEREDVLRSIAMQIAPFCGRENATQSVRDAVQAVGRKGQQYHLHLACLFASSADDIKNLEDHVRQSLTRKR